MSLPPHVRAAAERVLDRAARRLLDEADPHPARATPRVDVDPLDDGPDQRPPLGEGEPPPVLDGDREKARAA